MEVTVPVSLTLSVVDVTVALLVRTTSVPRDVVPVIVIVLVPWTISVMLLLGNVSADLILMGANVTNVEVASGDSPIANDATAMDMQTLVRQQQGLVFNVEKIQWVPIANTVLIVTMETQESMLIYLVALVLVQDQLVLTIRMLKDVP